MELLVVVRIDLRFYLLGREFVQLFLYRAHRGVGVVAADVDAASGLRDLATHIFVESADNDIALTVFHEVIRSGNGHRGSFGLTDADNNDLNTGFFGAFSDRDGIVFMVLSIGNEDDGTAGTALSGLFIGCPKATDRG